MRSYRIVPLLVAALLCSCDGGSGTSTPLGPGIPNLDPAPVVADPTLVLRTDPNAVYEGMTNWLDVSAFASDRSPVSTDKAVVTSSGRGRRTIHHGARGGLVHSH
jgi:hypothetical protein